MPGDGEAMTTLSSILQNSSAGLAIAQAGIGTVSTNVANLNTSGYVREELEQNSVANGGITSGVTSSGVVRAANQYLQNASLAANGVAGQAGAVTNYLSQAQSLFGDPSTASGYFNQLNSVFSDFSSLALDPTSTVAGTQALSDVNQFLSQSQSISTSLTNLSGTVDNSLGNDVSQVNQLLSQISSLNSTITATSAADGQTADLQNSQSELINQLSSLIGVKTTPTSSGGVVVTTDSGTQLVGQYGAATLSYSSSATGLGQVSVTSVTSDQQPQPLAVSSGDMGGLLSLRNTQIPGLQNQLGQFVTQTVNALNQASNASSSVPPPAQLNGQNIGLDLPTAVSGFSGTATIAEVNASGMLQHSVAINFSAGTISVDGGAATAFTPATFLSKLQTAMTSIGGSASFANGALSLSTGVSGDGLAIQDNATSANGQGFSQYFGLNNLISSGQITNYNTGLTATNANNFTAGGAISFAINDANGNPMTTVTVNVPSGGTMQSVLNALNANAGGVGLYGQFSLGAKGALTFTPTTSGVGLTVNSDTTHWSSATGASLSQLFGLGATASSSAVASYSVRSDIQANPALLQTATLDLSAASSNQPVLTSGDGSGAQLLAQAGSTTQSFAAAGSAAAISTSVTQYASQFAGSIANTASAASTASTNATSLQNEATSQLQSVEGVSLDQELINLTTYQQAYNASARLVTATQDMFQALITMVGQ